MVENNKLDKISFGGLLVTLGIIYGDIGTSPLYVIQAIFGNQTITKDLVYGSMSLIFWTLSLQTTIKYVVIILRADNKGEGGIFALYALVRRHAKWLTIPAIIGGAALLADGIITPPISVSSAIEGLQLKYPSIQPVPIVIFILSILFFIQFLGTDVVGRLFGPIMLIWFLMLAILGIQQIKNFPQIIEGLNPYYAYNLLFVKKQGFVLLGAVFLCTTGAEALYSDLGHVGRNNVRISWIFVKICLILNYLGQGAWAMHHIGDSLHGSKPFFELMPESFLLIGIIIATAAAVIASQALITGSFTLISEAIRLRFWPKVIIKYPTIHRGQLYISSVNWFLYAGCIAIVLYFKESAKMEAAYGLAITITMLMTTILASFYLYTHKSKSALLVLFIVVYLIIELGFLSANMLKFTHGGWVSILIAGSIAFVMYIWFRSSFIKKSLTRFEKLPQYLSQILELSKDITVPKYSTHLAFMTNANKSDEVERKIIQSIFERRPKRADVYWFIHVDITDEPYTMQYKVDNLSGKDIFRVDFKLGFRIEQKINLYFKAVLKEMAEKQEVDNLSRYATLRKYNFYGDLRYVVLERYLSNEQRLDFYNRIIMEAHFFIKQFTTPEHKWFNLEFSNVKVERVPLVINPIKKVVLHRIKSRH